MQAVPAFTLEIGLTLGVAGFALALFVWNRLRADVVGLIVMASLIVLKLVTPQEGISGFANEAVVTVGAMFVLSAGLSRTGGVDQLGRWVAHVAGDSEIRLLVLTLALVIPLSAFINNTPVVVVMIPLILGLAREKGFVASRLLMPISFGSQMGGTLTLVGTSTNLLVAGLVLELGMDRIRLFDITLPGLLIAAAGVAYLLTIGRWLTPVRKTESDLLSRFELREYATSLRVEPESLLIGRSLGEVRFSEKFGFTVVGIERGNGYLTCPDGDTLLEEGDQLLCTGKIPDIARVQETSGLTLSGTQADLSFLENSEKESTLAEIMIPPRSPLVGRTLHQLRFRWRYGVSCIAIQRHGAALDRSIEDTVLHQGDVLLVHGPPEAVQRVHESSDLSLLGPVDLPARRSDKLWIAISILVAVVGLAAFEVMTILVSSMLGVIALFISGCLRPEEAYEEIDWMVLVLLGSIIPLGIAMQNSGAAEFIAVHLIRLTMPLGLLGMLAGFYLLTSLLTEMISNNAAAIVLTPIAVAVATSLDVSPLPFVVAVMFAASNSFMTPVGYQTNMFIYGPGGYRFSDFVRVGGPLNVIMVITATFVISAFFPF